MLLYRYKIGNFTLTMSSVVYSLDDRGRRRTAVRSMEPIVHNFHKKSLNVCIFTFC